MKRLIHRINFSQKEDGGAVRLNYSKNSDFSFSTILLQKGNKTILQLNLSRRKAFCVISGRVEVSYLVEGEENKIQFGPNESFEIPSGVAYCLKAVEDLALFEIASCCLDDDTVLLEHKENQKDTVP